MEYEKLMIVLIIGGGVFSILGAIKNRNWFMNHNRAKFFVYLFGRSGARIIYILLGLGLVIGGIYMLSTGKY